eukprot:jgi/Chlat1/8161/Chrsp76S07617
MDSAAAAVVDDEEAMMLSLPGSTSALRHRHMHNNNRRSPAAAAACDTPAAPYINWESIQYLPRSHHHNQGAEADALSEASEFPAAASHSRFRPVSPPKRQALREHNATVADSWRPAHGHNKLCITIPTSPVRTPPHTPTTTPPPTTTITTVSPRTPAPKRRGASIRVTTPSAVADRKRRSHMNDRFDCLRVLVQGDTVSSSSLSKADVLDAAIKHVKQLQALCERRDALESGDDSKDVADLSGVSVHTRDGMDGAVTVMAELRCPNRCALLPEILHRCDQLSLQVLHGTAWVDGPTLHARLRMKCGSSRRVSAGQVRRVLLAAIHSVDDHNDHNVDADDGDSSKQSAVSVLSACATSLRHAKLSASPPCA